MEKKHLRTETFWRQFYECDCKGEGIMLSRDMIDGTEPPYIYVAYFREGVKYDKTLSFKQRCRLIWQIITEGHPWNDMVILRVETAEQLGKDLVKWAKETIERIEKSQKATTATPSVKTE